MASPAALSSDGSQPRYIICTVVNTPLTESTAGTCSNRQTVVCRDVARDAGRGIVQNDAAPADFARV
jgi:hypothetical protein